MAATATKPDPAGKRNAKGTKPPVTGLNREQWLAHHGGSYVPKPVIAQIINLRRSGLSYREIGERVNRNVDTIMRICHLPEVEAELNRGADELLMAYRQRVMQIVPEALDALMDLVKNHDRVAVIRLLLGSRTLIERHEEFLQVKEEPFGGGRSTEDMFYRAMHNHWPEEECHCGDPKGGPATDKGKV